MTDHYSDEKHIVQWIRSVILQLAGAVAGLLAVLCGIFRFFYTFYSPTSTCFLFSIWQILCGILVVAAESRVLMMEEDGRDELVGSPLWRTLLWTKAGLYIFVPLPALIFCFGANMFVGSGSIIAVGVVNGVLALRAYLKNRRNPSKVHVETQVGPSWLNFKFSGTQQV